MRNVALLLPSSLVLLLSACSPMETSSVRPDTSPAFKERNEEMFPGRRGTPVTIPMETDDGVIGMPAEIIDGLVIAGGDMVLGTEEELLGDSDAPEGAHHGVGVRMSKHRWEDRTVPYEIDTDLPEAVQELALNAIAHWQEVTSLDFVEATTESQVLKIKSGWTTDNCNDGNDNDGDGKIDGDDRECGLGYDSETYSCASYVGRQNSGDTTLTAKGCSEGNFKHEIGHAVGLYHEHARCDRDDYVIVNDTGVNYDTVCDRGDDGFDVGPYDITSVMHYGTSDMDGDDTTDDPNLTDLDDNDVDSQRDALTAWDIAAVERMYGGGVPLYKDVDSDGFEDLLIGVPGESDSYGSYAGAVTLVFGETDGLVSSADERWTQQSTGIPGDSEDSDNFGRAVAMGDFDGDGYCDVAVGTPYEDLSSDTNAGSVTVIPGSSGGLAGSSAVLWHQDTTDIDGDRETGDYFGDALVAGDFNGDTYADLVVGSSYEDVGTASAGVNAGAVSVIYGGDDGLAALTPDAAEDNKMWHRSVTDVAGDISANALFGSSLATGDFNGDGYGDLVVGVPGDTVTSLSAAGSVQVLYGTDEGLSATDDELWSQDSSSVEGTSESGDRFGFSVAVGDVDCDGIDDLIVGAPYEDIGSASSGVDAGSVQILYGADGGLTAAYDEILYRGYGIDGSPSASENLGYSVTAADFDGDLCDDLVIGVTGWDGDDGTNQGGFIVIPGSSSGPDTVAQEAYDAGDWIWTGLTESGARLGNSMTTGDWNNDGYPDLAVGAYLANEGSITYTGGVYVLFGAATGFDISNREVLYQDIPIISDTSESYDYFGFAVR